MRDRSTNPEQIGKPLDTRPLFPALRAELIALLSGLDRTEWELTTACPGWNVGDVATHILGDMLWRLSGAEARQEVMPQPGEDLADLLDRSNQEWVDVARRLSPAVVVGMIDWAGGQLDIVWQSVDLEAPSLGVPWAGVDPSPAWFDLAREFTEYWVHQQQIRDAASSPGGDPASLSVVLDVFARGLPHTLNGVLDPKSDWLVVNVTGGTSQRWVYERTLTGWSLVPVSAPIGSPEVRMDSDELWRLWVRDPAAPPRVDFDDDDVRSAVFNHVAIIRGG